MEKIKIKISMYGHLLNGKKEFYVKVYNSAEVKHCFYELFERFPGIKDKIFTKSDELRDDIRLLLNGVPIESTDVKVKDGDEICVFPVSAGG